MNSKPQGEKLQKVLARAGLGSRRLIEQWIEAGRVKVNKKIAKLGARVSDKDHIQVDERQIRNNLLFDQSDQRILIYNKDVGTVCSRADPDHPKTVFNDFPRITGGRWILIGRLDINTTGLLLVTNDGDLANRLMHPSFEVEREYLVRVLGKVDQAILKQLSEGIELEDGKAKFENIEELEGEGSNRWFRVMLREGRKRVVRRAWEALGFQVSRLNRIRYGSILLPKGIKRGSWQEMSPALKKALYKEVGLTLHAQKPQSKKHPNLETRGAKSKRTSHKSDPAKKKANKGGRKRRKE